MRKATPWILSLDVGTSSVRAQGYTIDGRPLRLQADCKHTPQITPDGGSEFSPQELTARCIVVLQQALAQRGHHPLPSAVAVCTFWHSLVGIKATGEAVTPVYTWADTRSAAYVRELLARIPASELYAESGCFAHTGYLPTRLLWLHAVMPDITKQVRWWLSFADYLYFQLFGELVTSHSMASGSGLYNPLLRQWSPHLCAVARISPQQLPSILDHGVALSGLRPAFEQQLPELTSVPWYPAYGDGACGNVGSGCVTPQKVAVMVGTSGAMRSVFPDTPPVAAGLWRYRLDPCRLVIGGALSNGGNALAWCRQTFRLPPHNRLQEQLAQLPPNAHNLTVLPFLAGERSTGWTAHARAALQGLSLATTPVQIYQAVMEAICLRFKAIYQRLTLQVAKPEVVASGGALLRSPVWLQMLADVLETPVIASAETQASCRGAALLVAEQLGFIHDLSAVEAACGLVYTPRPDIGAIYQEAFTRQTALYEKLVGPSPDAP